jgi:hypothetical protein
LKSHLTLHRQIALKKPYRRKTGSSTLDFARMAKAEAKRRRKHGTSGVIITVPPRLLWTPKH